MNDITIISYPGPRNNLLLSLTDSRSKYMIPFGGKFRVVDFTIGNSYASEARMTIIYSNYEDELEEYVERYGPFKEMKFPPIKVVSREFSDIKFCYNLILDTNTDHYIIYNGDNPSIIDFTSLIQKYRAKRKDAVLFKLRFSERATMANTILVTNQKALLASVNKAIDEKRESPNIFEMIINLMVNNNIPTGLFDVYYWPLKNVPDYFFSNIEILRDPKLFSFLYNGTAVKGKINTDNIARIGLHAKIANSFISDGCEIKGTVTNSIIFPGVSIGEKTVLEESIVLPYAKIGTGSRIINSVIDEGRNADTEILSIGNGCKVGSNTEQIRNNDFPRSIFSSITLIGKNCNIPDGSVIGGACYVSSGLGGDYFSKRKYLYDGLSVIK